jgi:hypothetical protein
MTGPREQIGERLAGFVVGLLESEDGRERLVGIVRAAASEPAAADLLRELLSREVLARLAAGLGVDDADVRANLVGSQVVGLVMARYIVAVEPLASLSGAAVRRLVAPTLQRYMTAPLPL